MSNSFFHRHTDFQPILYQKVAKDRMNSITNYTLHLVPLVTPQTPMVIQGRGAPLFVQRHLSVLLSLFQSLLRVGKD